MLQYDVKAQFVVDVFAAVVEHIVARGESPTVREVCAAIGWNGEKEVWWALQILERLGLIYWPVDEHRGHRAHRGIRLQIELNKPTIIPIVGYLGKPADFVPGTRWVEIHTDGKIIVVEGEEKWEGTLTGHTSA